MWNLTGLNSQFSFLSSCLTKAKNPSFAWIDLNVCCKQYSTSPGGSTPTKQLLYSHLPTITKIIKVRRTRYVGHCWRSRDELISDTLLWTPSHGWAKAGHPARTYIQQLCADTGCSLEDLPEAMDNREGWQERVRKIHDNDDEVLTEALHYRQDKVQSQFLSRVQLVWLHFSFS